MQIFFRFVPEMSFSGAITVIHSSSHLVRRSSLPAVRTKHTINNSVFYLAQFTHTYTDLPQDALNKEDSSNDSLPVYVIVASAVGAVIVVAIGLVIICCFYLYRHRKMMAVFKVNLFSIVSENSLATHTSNMYTS